jgi:hypothetical protein
VALSLKDQVEVEGVTTRYGHVRAPWRSRPAGWEAYCAHRHKTIDGARKCAAERAATLVAWQIEHDA